MAKDIKVTKKFVKEVMSNYAPREVEWRGITFKVDYSIDMSKVIEIVRAVVSCCFTDDGEYFYEIAKGLYRFYVINSYTNLKLMNFEDTYIMLMQTDLWDTILANANKEQIEDMWTAIELKFHNIMDFNAKNVEREINNAVASLSQLSEQTIGMFDGVDPSEFSAMVEELSEKDLNEEKLMKAYLKHKK